MGIVSILAAVGITIPIVMGGVYWLLQILIKHQLTAAIEGEKAGFARQLETHKMALADQLEEKKAALQADLTREKAGIEGEVRRKVEFELGQQAAERQYELEARRRLYLAVGPLRFQLLVACRDFVGRIVAHGHYERYKFDLRGYYGQSTLYRLLRPLAISELIERQIAYSDFSIDKGAIDCLRFKKTLVRILSGNEVIEGHPKLNWDSQIEHVYADAAIIGAAAIICAEGGAQRVMRFEEFAEAINRNGVGGFEPFSSLFRDFKIKEKPILWLRLVAYAHACNQYVIRAGESLDFESQELEVAKLITMSEDPFIEQNQAKLVGTINDNALMRL